MMNSIIDNQRDILLSIQGTNIWSGQQPQQYNSQAIAWGGLSHELFSTGQRYEWVPLAYLVGLIVPIPFWVIHRYWPKLRADYLYTPVIVYVLRCFEKQHAHMFYSYYIGWLCVGINSSILSYFAIAFLSQWWLRTRYPRWFSKYNYIVGAGEYSHLYRMSISNRVMKPLTEALKSWCSSSRLRCKALGGLLTCSQHGGERSREGITTTVPCLPEVLLPLALVSGSVFDNHISKGMGYAYVYVR